MSRRWLIEVARPTGWSVSTVLEESYTKMFPRLLEQEQLEGTRVRTEVEETAGQWRPGVMLLRCGDQWQLTKRAVA